jgi:hypothetical protein
MSTFFGTSVPRNSSIYWPGINGDYNPCFPDHVADPPLFFNTANLKENPNSFNETKLDELVGTKLAQKSKRLAFGCSSLPQTENSFKSDRNKAVETGNSVGSIKRTNRPPKYNRTYKKCVVPTSSGKCDPRSHTWWKPTSDVNREIK